MTKLILRFFDCFAWLLRRLDVDYDQFRAILEAKLTLDSRRQMSGMQQQRTQNPKNTFAWTLLFYAFMGGFLGIFLPRTTSPLVGMTIVHAFVMTMVALSLIADFTSVLLDTTDRAVLQPRPVTSRTILVTRIAHITIYLSLLTLSLSVVTLVVGTFTYHGLFPLVFLGTLACSVCLVVFVAQVFYLVALRLTDAERFRDLILYFQIGMTVAVIVGYQILPRLMDMTRLSSLTIDEQWWIYFFPPAWLAAPIDLLTGHIGTPQIILTGLAVAVPLICLILVIRVLAPGFSRALARLDSTPTGSSAAVGTASLRQPLARRLSGFFARRASERAAFELVWQLCSRDRQFKQRTYPTFAFLFVFAAVWVLLGEGGAGAALRELPHTQKYFLILYFSCMMAPMTIIQLRFSAAHEAAWMYHALPLERPGDILIGAFKVVMVRFVAPVFGLMALAILLVWGLRIAVDVVFAACATVLVSVLQAMIFGRTFPFSEEFNVAQNTGQVVRSMFLMLIPAALGGLHFVMRLISPLTLPSGALLVLVLAIVLLRRYARTNWIIIRRSRP